MSTDPTLVLSFIHGINMQHFAPWIFGHIGGNCGSGEEPTWDMKMAVSASL